MEIEFVCEGVGYDFCMEPDEESADLCVYAVWADENDDMITSSSECREVVPKIGDKFNFTLSSDAPVPEDEGIQIYISRFDQDDFDFENFYELQTPYILQVISSP